MKKVFLGIVIGAVLVCAISFGIAYIKNINSTNIRNDAVRAYKEFLLDNEWIKDNLKMKKNCFGEDMKSDEQALTFKMIDMGYNLAPIIVVNSYVYEGDNGDFGNQIYFIKYENGNVVVESLKDIPAHPGHVNFVVSDRYKSVELCYMHMGVVNNEIYNIENKSLVMSYGYNEDIDAKGNLIATCNLNSNLISQEAFKSLDVLHSKNYAAIDTELTKENIESIIK